MSTEQGQPRKGRERCGKGQTERGGGIERTIERRRERKKDEKGETERNKPCAKDMG